ncbi:hypothetical protein L2E82_41549 [Cichorium intybus]|uniref:Uncharacterized protein n=1 Tax=Cichorium intybus TaxID=13427 RepID=A0ACB9ANN4_CICIN|nr:hypothetical protein L2E82_41549 [Cichorium intybus]
MLSSLRKNVGDCLLRKNQGASAAFVLESHVLNLEAKQNKHMGVKMAGKLDVDVFLDFSILTYGVPTTFCVSGKWKIDKKEGICKDEFDINAYMDSLVTTCFGRFVIWSPRLPSTQDIVSFNFCGIPVASVCIADVQFKGRGRSQNVWEYRKGSLVFSFTVQMEDGHVVPLVQYVVCFKDLAIKIWHMVVVQEKSKKQDLSTVNVVTVLLQHPTSLVKGKTRKSLRFLRAGGPLTAVVLGTAFVKIFHPSSISLVGDIPQGLTPFSIPKEFGQFKSLIPTAMLITGVAIPESVGIAKALVAKNGYELDSNQDEVTDH